MEKYLHIYSYSYKSYNGLREEVVLYAELQIKSNQKILDYSYVLALLDTELGGGDYIIISHIIYNNK